MYDDTIEKTNDLFELGLIFSSMLLKKDHIRFALDLNITHMIKLLKILNSKKILSKYLDSDDLEIMKIETNIKF